MTVLSTIAVAAEEKLAPLILPNWAFPLIAAILFVFLAIVVYSYRDVSNRHRDRSTHASSTEHGTDH